MPEKCLLCIELLLFLSLKMKRWHITDTGLDFADIPALTHVHLVEKLSCSAASSTCTLQRSRAQRVLGICRCPRITPAGSAHPAAPQSPGSCLGGCQPELCGQREQDSAARAAWPKISCFWKRQINSTCLLSFLLSSLSAESWIYFLNMGICLESTQTWTHGYTCRHTCVCGHLHSRVCFIWMVNRAEESSRACPSSAFKPTIPCCTLGVIFKCRFGVLSWLSWISRWWWCPGVCIYDRW